MKITPTLLPAVAWLGGSILLFGCSGGDQSNGLSQPPNNLPTPTASPGPIATPTPTPTPGPIVSPVPTPAPPTVPVVPTTPLPARTADQIRAVPQAVVVQGKTLIAVAGVWINRMPSTNQPDLRVIATIRIFTADGSALPAGLQLERISVAQGGQVWAPIGVERRDSPASLAGTIRGGPYWVDGATVDTVGDFYDSSGTRYQVRAATGRVMTAH